jgi:hypothetical protein
MQFKLNNQALGSALLSQASSRSLTRLPRELNTVKSALAALAGMRVRQAASLRHHHPCNNGISAELTTRELFMPCFSCYPALPIGALDYKRSSWERVRYLRTVRPVSNARTVYRRRKRTYCQAMQPALATEHYCYQAGEGARKALHWSHWAQLAGACIFMAQSDPCSQLSRRKHLLCQAARYHGITSEQATLPLEN